MTAIRTFTQGNYRGRVNEAQRRFDELAACTYEIVGKLDVAVGLRYLVRRSDGWSGNLPRSTMLRIQHQGKLTNGRQYL